MESETSALFHAKKLKAITKKLEIPFIYKSSYDKANRTSIRSFRGPGLKKGIGILKKIKSELKIPVLSDVHSSADIERAKDVLDIIQIPAFLSRQTDLIVEAAKTGKVVNVKKGQFLAPWDVKHIIEKIESAGCKNILITERGTSFGYNALVSDLRAIPIMRSFGYPVIYDATHSVQAPGGKGDSSGGNREFVEPLAMSAVVCGADAIFLEVHEDPNLAMSDGPNMLALNELENFLKKIKKIESVIKKG